MTELASNTDRALHTTYGEMIDDESTMDLKGSNAPDYELKCTIWCDNLACRWLSIVLYDSAVSDSSTR